MDFQDAINELNNINECNTSKKLTEAAESDSSCPKCNSKDITLLNTDDDSNPTEYFGDGTDGVENIIEKEYECNKCHCHFIDKVVTMTYTEILEDDNNRRIESNEDIQVSSLAKIDDSNGVIVGGCFWGGLAWSFMTSKAINDIATNFENFNWDEYNIYLTDYKSKAHVFSTKEEAKEWIIKFLAHELDLVWGQIDELPILGIMEVNSLKTFFMEYNETF